MTPAMGEWPLTAASDSQVKDELIAQFIEAW
jgi:hypothetical protein